MKILTSLIEQNFSISGAEEILSDEVMTYEEENAVRYVGGYIIRSIRKDCMHDKDILVELNHLCNNDDNSEPSESEEWMCSIDRGGLIRIGDGLHQTLCCIEYRIRHHFSTANNPNTEHTVSVKAVVDDILDDCDVQFHCCLACYDMDQSVSDTLLKTIVSKWVTIRGFSFAKSILERYKQIPKKQHKRQSH